MTDLQPGQLITWSGNEDGPVMYLGTERGRSGNSDQSIIMVNDGYVYVHPHDPEDVRVASAEEAQRRPLQGLPDWVVRPVCVQLEQPPEGTEWRLVPDELHMWQMERGSAICGDTHGWVVDLKKYQNLNSDPVPVIEPGMWVAHETHGAGIAVRVNPSGVVQVMHENEDELYIEHYSIDELTVDASPQAWAEHVASLLISKDSEQA